MGLLQFVWPDWLWSGGDEVGNETEQMWESFPRAGLTCHSKEPRFYHLCVGGSLQILMGFALSVNGFIYRDISQSHGDRMKGLCSFI